MPSNWYEPISTSPVRTLGRTYNILDSPVFDPFTSRILDFQRSGAYSSSGRLPINSYLGRPGYKQSSLASGSYAPPAQPKTLLSDSIPEISTRN